MRKENNEKENNNWGKKKSYLTVLLFDDVVGKIMGKDKSLLSLTT